MTRTHLQLGQKPGRTVQVIVDARFKGLGVINATRFPRWLNAHVRAHLRQRHAAASRVAWAWTTYPEGRHGLFGSPHMAVDVPLAAGGGVWRMRLP